MALIQLVSWYDMCHVQGYISSRPQLLLGFDSVGLSNPPDDVDSAGVGRRDPDGRSDVVSRLELRVVWAAFLISRIHLLGPAESRVGASVLC